MLQNAQNTSPLDEDLRMVAETTTEAEDQRTYQQAMQVLDMRLRGELVLPMAILL